MQISYENKRFKPDLVYSLLKSSHIHNNFMMNRMRIFFLSI